MKLRRKRKEIPLLNMMVFGFIFFVLLLMLLIVFSPKKKAVQTVNAFYTYEQKGDHASSWSLLHPIMQLKFEQAAYIQDRSQMLMKNFGADTFTFQLGNPKKVKNWKVSEDSPIMKPVYRVPVTQLVESKYGNFTIQQQVFVVKEKRRWKILWDYNQ